MQVTGNRNSLPRRADGLWPDAALTYRLLPGARCPAGLWRFYQVSVTVLPAIDTPVMERAVADRRR